METAAGQSVGVGSPVVLPDGTVAMIDASDGHVAECVWFVGLDVQRASHPLTELRVATPDEITVANAKWGAPGAATPPGAAPLAAPATSETTSETTTKAPTTLGLLVDFQRWLGTRDERIGPFSRVHEPPSDAQSTRVAAEYLAEQA
ncbi:MAG: hypothetical protein JWP02_3557 [Acidimicrobiales bacterium]|nr:hypothetical protein [Acidimicrobiales bacterium]